MKVSVDTNVLVRGAMRDDVHQSRAADKLLREAEVIAVTLPCLCEFVWVLRKLYQVDKRDIAAAIRSLIASANVATNRPAVEAGLAMLDAGGDFADGVIAYDGEWLGGEIFASFDKRAVALLSAQGRAALQM